VDRALFLGARQPSGRGAQHVPVDAQYSYVVPSSGLALCEIFNVTLDTALERPIALRDMEDAHDWCL